MTLRPHLPLPDTIRAAYDDRPRYDRRAAPGIVHLGTGAFHRAHQAVYFHQLMNAGETGWMIQGASLRSARVAEQMNPQDGLYTAVVRDNGSDRHELIGSIRGVLVAPDDPAALIDAMAQRSVQLVTLTITEKGYCIDPATGHLRMDDAGIAHDIAHIDAPRTAPGFLVAALKARREAGMMPFTVLSCDNLPDNGERTRDAVVALARAVEPALGDWIAAEGAFPSSMVDRIVPATTEEDIAALQTAMGWRDEAMVKTEPFSQWVVEDWFVGARPPLERVGVQMTKDVAAWEKAKLRLLNGAHSGLAYLGALAGHTFVHEAMVAPGYAAFVRALWDEAQATLDPIEGFDAERYRAELTDRFCNSSLRHRTVQIAMDGSQKLPQRLLNTIRDRLAMGLDSPALTLAVAGWMRWQMGTDDAGARHEVDDPLAAETAAAVARGAGDAGAIARELIGLHAIFGSDLPAHNAFVRDVTDALQLLLNEGSAARLARLARIEAAS